MTYIAHTLIWLTVSFVLPNHKQFIRVNRMLYIAHTFIWLPISFVFPNHKQFIRVNRMLCIAHAFIWLPVSFVPPHHKQLIELNRMPFITHATKIWTVFDASSIANVFTFFDGFHTPLFAIIASHTVSRRVSDWSVASAASCSSVLSNRTLLPREGSTKDCIQVLFHKHVWLYSEYMPTLHWWTRASSVSPYVITVAWGIASDILSITDPLPTSFSHIDLRLVTFLLPLLQLLQKLLLLLFPPLPLVPYYFATKYFAADIKSFKCG